MYTDNRVVGYGYQWKMHFQYTKHVVGTPLWNDSDQTWRPTQNGIYAFDCNVQVKNSAATTSLLYLYKNDQPYLCDYNYQDGNNRGSGNKINVKLYLTTSDWVHFVFWNPIWDWNTYVYNVSSPTYYKDAQAASPTNSAIISWISCTYLN
jgi:hypothetical protein